MAQRKGISKKTRFEVFKRDSFKCQYCGRPAPEVVLQVDHIHPVAKGGENDITNYITSCFDCNAGKKDRELSDDAVIQKRKAQLDELQERREQLEMMVDWQRSLINLERQQADMAADLFNDLTGYSITEQGKKKLLTWCRRFGLAEILEATKISVEQYLERDKDDKATSASAGKSFDYIEKICRTRKTINDKPYMKDLYYVRGILRNRFSYIGYEAMDLIETVYLTGVPVPELKRIAITSRNWTEWRDYMTTIANMPEAQSCPGSN